MVESDELLTNTSIAALMNILERMLLVDQRLELVHNIMAQKETVTICFEAKESCSFLKELRVHGTKDSTDRAPSIQNS
jgi:hypothetical protein